ncbi:MAG: LuxR C-terminal-related transcriptional regulator [Candidatus Acidiferrum sp.]
MCKDIAAVKRSDDGLRSLGRTRDALYAVDNEQRIIYWNEGARKLLGYREADVLGKPCWRVMAGRRGNRPWCQRNCRIHRCVTRDILPPHHYFETRTKKGQSVWVGVSVLTMQVEGKPISAHLLTSLPHEERLRRTIRKMQGSVEIESKPRIVPTITAVPSPKNPSASSDTVDENNLTRREIQVLKLLAEGLSTQGIASHAGISYFTARNHIQNGLRKIGLSSRAQAVSFAYSRGLI